MQAEKEKWQNSTF